MEENTKKMLAGLPFQPDSDELSKMRLTAHNLCHNYNQTTEDQEEERINILNQLFPHHEGFSFIQGPLHVDYGLFTHIGKNFYANFNLTILDGCPITIGDNVMIGPNVSLITATHPLQYQQRNPHQIDGKTYVYEYGKPITIGNNCWLGANVTVCPGVKIGDGCVVGAGAVVTSDMPDNSLILGVPAKAVRQITDNDHLDNMPY